MEEVVEGCKAIEDFVPTQHEGGLVWVISAAPGLLDQERLELREKKRRRHEQGKVRSKT